MANLKARGRTEIVRMTRENNVTKETYENDPNPRVWARETIALMSDGAVLEKRDVRWKDGSKHSYGWKVLRKIQRDPHQFAEQFTAALLKAGYVATS